jgi:hypothetical protein
MSETKTRFTVTVWVDVPHDDENHPEESKQEVERMVIKAVSRFFDCDAEVMDEQVVEE